MKVSIVTCTYNSAATVADTIKSVNSQTYPDIEHIIVDGLSKDNTVDIANTLSTYRQHIICEKDNGIYDAFNKGIKAASGDIVGVLNSDDFFTSPDVVANIVKVQTRKILLIGILPFMDDADGFHVRPPVVLCKKEPV